MNSIPFPVVWLLLSFALSNCQTGQKTADTIYLNGKIYTVNEAQPWAEAVAIKNGLFLAVGTEEDIDSYKGPNTVVVDLGGKFAMPGIVDMHAHPFTGVEMGSGGVNIQEPNNPDAILEAVKAYAEANPDKPAILGGNWNVGGIFPKDSPDKKLLDAIVPDRPVFMLSQSGHSAWVNSKALEIAGIDDSYHNQGAYIFDRYPGTNEPSGTVRESAMVLIINQLGYMAPEAFASYFPAEIERYSKFGVTAIQPAEGSITWLQGAALLEKEAKLNVRLFPALDWVTSQLRALDDAETEAFIADWKTYETELIKPHYVKIFADGSADSHTLLMKEPYADAPETQGSMYLPAEQYREAILNFYSQGITPHIHTMGDSTSSVIIGIFEEAEATYPDSKASLHFGHSQSVDDKELNRLKALRTASMNFSPMLAVPHPQMDLFLTTPLGEERHQAVFPVKQALDKGIIVGFGSDFPSSLVPEPNQFWYMEGWVTRQVPGSPEYGTINPDASISVEEAIRGFTLGGAEALGNGYSELFGSIEKGKSADLIVLNQNLLEIPVSEIHNTEVEVTIFRGKVVYNQ